MKRLLELAATMLEAVRVLLVLPRIETSRRTLGPKQFLERLRRQGRRTPPRDARARARLRRAIGWVDACMPRGGNCYRRALLEIALDAAAAGEPLHLGFNLQDNRLSGHAWLATQGGQAEDYGVTLRL